MEQEIFDLVGDTGVIFTHDIIRAMDGFANHQTVRNSLSSLEKKGFLFRIKKGAYLRSEEHGPIINDPLMVGNNLFRGYVAFSSALRHYDLIEYEPFTVFIATAKQSASLQIPGSEI